MLLWEVWWVEWPFYVWCILNGSRQLKAIPLYTLWYVEYKWCWMLWCQDFHHQLVTLGCHTSTSQQMSYCEILSQLYLNLVMAWFGNNLDHLTVWEETCRFHWLSSKHKIVVWSQYIYTIIPSNTVRIVYKNNGGKRNAELLLDSDWLK